MKKHVLLLLALAIPVQLIAVTSWAADTTGPKIVFEPEQSTLKFIDEKGNVLKEIFLVPEKTTAKIKDVGKKREWDGEKVVIKAPRISKNSKFVVMNNSIVETPLRTKEYLQEYRETGPIVTGAIALHDGHGDVLFEKVFRMGTGIPGAPPALVVSDTGIVAVITGSGEDPELENVLHVYRRSGVEIFAYPEKEGEKVYPMEILGISSNGRYLAVRVDFPFPEFPKTVFFDLEKNAAWKADRNYFWFKEITDDGIVKASYKDQIEKKAIKTEINLKHMFGREEKPAFSERPIGKCGDEVCDEFEKANPNLCPKDCEQAAGIFRQELERGWYYGSQSQKEAGTPDDWLHDLEGTRSACWHRPGVQCGQEKPGKEAQKSDRTCAHNGEMCGGIAGVLCCPGLTCKLEGNYPDASGICIK